MSSRVIRDLRVGLQSEQANMPHIKNALQLDKIKRSMGKFAHYDFIGTKDDDKIIVELKTRNIKFNQYPTVFINLCKMEYFKQVLDKNIKCYLFYKFNDGLYHFEVTLANINAYLLDHYCSPSNKQSVCSIKMNDLTKVISM